MQFFKIILFSIIINVHFFTSEKEIIFEEKNCESIYVSTSFSEKEAINILKVTNNNIDNFDYIAHCNKIDSIFVVILDHEDVLETFCTLLFEATKTTIKDIETAKNDAIEFALLGTTFVMDEYKKKLINTLKDSSKNELSLILNISEVEPSIIILCDFPKKFYIGKDLIKAYSNFLKLQSSKYEDINEICHNAELRNNIINIMISQFISNVACASLLLFPQQGFEDQHINTFVYSKKPITANSKLLKDKYTENIKELIK